jgi:hypothetical protein
MSAQDGVSETGTQRYFTDGEDEHRVRFAPNNNNFELHYDHDTGGQMKRRRQLTIVIKLGELAVRLCCELPTLADIWSFKAHRQSAMKSLTSPCCPHSL